ncbi:cytochrome b [Rhodococcus marinonascens]|uniref:cytochrome b n=1 Tax=Rhodococcus marinonascens TaxID=38311 RepID=UPI0009325A7B|nr:cytochrome b/b6 domain-containing protein [Rhodococcus marinonascens]
MNDKPIGRTPRFALPSRLLHWAMAVMVIAQLFIGVTMVASLANYNLLQAIHRPLGIAILIFVVVRIGNRLLHKPPPFLSTMRPWERRVATRSEQLLYALLVVQPLVGWAMLSSAGVPIVLFGQLHLPGIAPHNTSVYAVLWYSHATLAYLLFATFTAHMCAILFHTLVIRDRILDRMALWPTPGTKPAAEPVAEPTD